MSLRRKSRLYCGTFWSSEEGRRGSSQVVVFVLLWCEVSGQHRMSEAVRTYLWSTK